MKFYVHKLGCPKNDVDADYIYARLIQDGHQPVKNPQKADSIIVNTCGFILPAKEESINELLRLGQLKKNGLLKTLYAAGCLSQKFGDDLLKGDVNFKVVMKALKEIKFTGFATAEMIPFSRGDKLVLPDMKLARATSKKMDKIIAM